MKNLIICFLLAMTSAFAADPAKPADLSGVWRGTHTSGGACYQHYIKVQRAGAGYAGQGLTWFALTEEQAQAAARGQKPAAENPTAMCVSQQFAIKLDGETITFAGVSVQSLHNGGKYSPDVFSGKLSAANVVTGKAADAKKTDGIFSLYKEGALAKPLPLELEKGKTHSLGCVDGGDYHYTVYIPKNYDPEKPTPILINFNPGGGGEPLSPKMAEETGWIMAGLTESKNGPWGPIVENRDAALFDLRRRFNVDMKHVYFSGLSGGARASATSGVTFPGICAGLILIGAANGNGTPPKDQPIFYIAGQTDMNKGEVESTYEKALKAGRKCKLIIHPGGHDWGRAEDHEAAIKWLAELAGPAKPPAKK